MTTPIDPDTVPIPALLRAARGSYGHAIGAILRLGGFEDMPRNGPFVLGGMVNHGGSAGDLVRQLGISKQAASQLVDILVGQGYLERSIDAEDRRRVTIEATERGQAAAEVIGDAVAGIDAELAGRIGPTGVESLRLGLIALIDIRERLEDEARARQEALPGDAR